MAQTALPAPRRRRVLGGLLDADGWAWAAVKAVFWFVVIIMLLGYIPDRAYYFTVQRTLDIGLLAWSPINFCPPENEGVPCPAAAGATLPWHPAPEEVRLPAGRTDGSAAVIGQVYLYAGGTAGDAAAADVYVSHAVGTGNLDVWSPGPSLPEARTDAASVVVGNTLYVIGGLGPDGAPTDTVYSLTVGNDATLPEAWVEEEALVLPEPRAGSSAVAVADGIVLLGGTNGTAATTSVWKSRQQTGGGLGEWVPQSPLFEANVDGVAAHVGDIIFLIGGRNEADAVVSSVQQAFVGGPQAPADDPNAIVAQWRVSSQTNLPAPRTNMSGFTANGGIYIQGGSDGSTQSDQTFWATPDAGGTIPGWKNLAQTDLGQGIEGSAAVVSGSHAFVIAGRTADGITNDIARTNLAPQEPFFQLGLLGATVPALKLDGEVGQQLGYLNAATIGAINFVLLILIGYAYNHPAKVRSLWARFRRR
ncbi:MAG TPA: kelch repeat-containing protein [Candidatus Limnocylindrales bacterium]|nr:kelch repeat-containing protein [Candidatus Limnocylindrales bacterium]